MKPAPGSNCTTALSAGFETSHAQWTLIAKFDGEFAKWDSTKVPTFKLIHRPEDY